MTLIDVVASESEIFNHPRRRSGHVLPAMSTEDIGPVLDGPVELIKSRTSDVAGLLSTPGGLVNGSSTTPPYTYPDVESRLPASGQVRGQREFSASPSGTEIGIANVGRQESRGNPACNTGSAGGSPTHGEASDTEHSICTVTQANSIQTSNGETNTDIHDDHALQRRDDGDFPGDGSESSQPITRVKVPPPINVNGLATNDIGSFGEISVDDASELLDQLGKPPDSPATIDVTEITQLEASELERPQDFGSDGLCLRDSSGAEERDHSSPAMVRESHVNRVTPLTPSASVPVMPASSTQGDQTLHRGGSADLIDGSVRSRSSTLTSQSTEGSSPSITGDDQGPDEPGFVDVNLHSQTGPGNAGVVSSRPAGAKPKKKTLSGFLAKNLFRKSSREVESEAPPPDQSSSWGLFGQTPPGSPSRSSRPLSAQQWQSKGQTHPPTSSTSWRNRKPGMKHASSTTALILEDRPPHLPAKDPEEDQRHHEEYEQMVQGAKKKELKQHKKELKELEVRLKHEEGVQLHLQTWREEILPNWETMRNNKKTKDLWWQGIPPSIRGKVWMMAIGNELNITPELFEIFLLRAKDRIKYISELDLDEEEDQEAANAGSREDSVDVIKLDVARTFPHLCIFQKGGPFYEPLHSVLGAYACYRPDVGYLQGMSFIAAVFLLYLDPPQAFHCFANLLNKSCLLAFFRLDQQVMKSYFNAYEEFFQLYMPRLYGHFQDQNLRPDIYILDWIFTLYIKTLPLDVACVILDVFFRDGEEFLFRTALGILKHFEEVLLRMDFIQIAQFLCKLPITLTAESLFQSISVIDMHHQKKFKEVLASHLAQSLASS